MLVRVCRCESPHCLLAMSIALRASERHPYTELSGTGGNGPPDSATRRFSRDRGSRAERTDRSESRPPPGPRSAASDPDGRGLPYMRRQAPPERLHNPRQVLRAVFARLVGSSDGGPTQVRSPRRRYGGPARSDAAPPRSCSRVRRPQPFRPRNPEADHRLPETATREQARARKKHRDAATASPGGESFSKATDKVFATERSWPVAELPSVSSRISPPASTPSSNRR